MDRKEPERVGDVLRVLLQESMLQDRMEELQAAELWAKVVGPQIARECGKPAVRKGLMSVGVNNASLRHELHMSRTRLKEMINNHLGKEVIKEIKFIS